ncbi:MAG TPA: hypothetical protein VJP80_02255 [Candidatus Saccharimonadales bacterium]|nr:hypothetical protein [Candidatus Saccharimonadales bacterium]
MMELSGRYDGDPAAVEADLMRRFEAGEVLTNNSVLAPQADTICYARPAEADSVLAVPEVSRLDALAEEFIGKEYAVLRAQHPEIAEPTGSINDPEGCIEFTDWYMKTWLRATLHAKAVIRGEQA